MTNPDGYTALDLVGYTDQGDYNATKSYVANDLVHYGGSIWCCLIDDTVGITPTEGVNWRLWVENSQNGISDIVNILGAKNLLKVSATTTTINGVTFTVNSDDSITVNGTATAKAVLVLSRQDFGTAYISTAQGGTISTSKYIISGLSRNNDLYLSYSAQTTNIVVQSGYTADNVRIYPMIRPKNIEDDTWVPYTKTNKELTEEVTQNTSDIQTLTNSIAPTEDDTNYSQSYVMGDEFYRNGILYKVTATSVSTSDAINTSAGGNATVADNITSQIKTLHNKTNVIIFGDSWTDSAHDSNIRVDVMIEKQFGVHVHNYSVGGTGFDVPNGYDEQITRFAADNIDPNTIKFILLSAGGNEYYRDNVSASAFAAKLEDWYSKLKAVIGIDIPIYWSISYSIDDDYTLTYPTNYFNQFNYYTAVIESLNAPITQILTFGMVKSWRNNTHPDLAGHITLGQGIINSIKGVAPLKYPYEEVIGEVQDPDFSGGFRNVAFSCYANGPSLDCELKFAMGTLGTIPSGTQILFPKSLPAYVTNGLYLGEGCIITNRAANSFEVNVQNTSARTWTRSMSGNKAIKFTLT